MAKKDDIKEKNTSCVKDPRNAKIFGQPNYHEQNLCFDEEGEV